jgi:carbamoylphosphate synthase large subunit
MSKRTKQNLILNDWIYVGTNRDELQVWYRNENNNIISYAMWNPNTEEISDTRSITLEQIQMLKGIEQSIMLRSLGYGK